MKNYVNLAEIVKLICHSQLWSTGYTYSLYKHHVRFDSLTHLVWSKQFSIFQINMHIIYIIFYKYSIIYANRNDLMKTNKPSTHTSLLTSILPWATIEYLWNKIFIVLPYANIVTIFWPNGRDSFGINLSWSFDRFTDVNRVGPYRIISILVTMWQASFWTFNDTCRFGLDRIERRQRRRERRRRRRGAEVK